jgi:hypothetical protein
VTRGRRGGGLPPDPRFAEAGADPRFLAAVDLVDRTGADEFQIRFCDEEKPVVWIAAARYPGAHRGWQAAGGMTPQRALFALLDSVVDGGQCKHCGRMTGFEASADHMPLSAAICWYQYDPSTRKFARGCAQ